MPTQVSLLDGALASAGTLAIQTNGTTSAITISSAQVATFVNNPIMTGLTASRAVFTDGSKGLTSNAITGTGNVVMSASPTLTGTIDGAALTLSSSLTLSGGTANGVVYLNGSKVATSGSALTFDGSYLNLSRGSSGTLLNLTDAVAQTFRVATTASTVNLDSASGGSLAFLIGSSEQMRLTSTGLGIGTSSPSYKLDVNTSGGAVATARLYGNDQANVRLRLQNAGAGGRTWEIVGGYPGANNANFSILDVTGSTVPLTIDTSGNLGIGTISPLAKLDVNGQIVAQNGSTSSLGYAFRLALSSGMYLYDDGVGANVVLQANANNNQLYLQRTGNVGIGTSSPTASLDVYSASGAQIQLHSSASGTGSSDGSRIQLSGTDLLFVNRESASMQFYTADTERARIDSSGVFLVGDTSAITNVVGIQATTATSARWPIACKSVNRGLLVRQTDVNGGIAAYFEVNNGTNVGAINTTATATSYATSSDYRLKENIQPMQNALGVVAQLKPVTYTWKADGSEGQGFIAHELQAVVPDCVTGEKDAVDADGKPIYQGIDTSFLVATLTAAIQELKAEFDAYKATHP